MRNITAALLLSWAVAAPAAAQTSTARATQSAQTALDRYVAAADPSFQWKAVRDLPAGDGLTATLLDMTSQRWLTEKEVERPLWTHWVTVVRPTKITSDIGFLYITGGSLDREPPAAPTGWLAEMARRWQALSSPSFVWCESSPLASWTIPPGRSARKTTSSPTRGTTSSRPATIAGRRGSR
jgi:hypothetical protein